MGLNGYGPGKSTTRQLNTIPHSLQYIRNIVQKENVTLLENDRNMNPTWEHHPKGSSQHFPFRPYASVVVPGFILLLGAQCSPMTALTWRQDWPVVRRTDVTAPYQKRAWFPPPRQFCQLPSFNLYARILRKFRTEEYIIIASEFCHKNRSLHLAAWRGSGWCETEVLCTLGC